MVVLTSPSGATLGGGSQGRGWGDECVKERIWSKLSDALSEADKNVAAASQGSDVATSGNICLLPKRQRREIDEQRSR